MKILIFGTNRIKVHNWGHELWKQEIARQHDVRFYGYGYGEGHIKPFELNEVIDELEFEPDLIYTHWARDVGLGPKGLAETDIPKVHYTTEYFHWNYRKEDHFIKKYEIDLVLVPNSPMVERMSSLRGFNARLLPFSVDTNIFKPRDVERNLSVSAVMHAKGWYCGRIEILENVEAIEDSYIFGAWRNSKKLFHDVYIGVYTRSKMAVNGCRIHESSVGTRYSAGTQSDFPYLTFTNWKNVEIPACGAILLTQETEDLEIMGFRHLENCVMFDNPNEIPSIVNGLLEDNERREKIAKAGLEHVRQHHSNEVRVQEFTKIVKELI